MALDLDMFDDDDLDWGINDCGDIWMPPPKKIVRDSWEIIDLEYQIINECTDLQPDVWIKMYAERFRAIMDLDESLTKSQVKNLLYRRN